MRNLLRSFLTAAVVLCGCSFLADAGYRSPAEINGNLPSVTITHATGACGTCTETASVEWTRSPTNWYRVTFVYTVSSLGTGTGGIIGFALPNGSTSSTRGASCVGQSGPGTYVAGGYMASSSPNSAWINITTLAAATYVLSCTYLSAT